MASTDKLKPMPTSKHPALTI